MKRTLRIALPLLMILVGAAGAAAMFMSRDKPVTRTPDVVLPLVRVEQVELRDIRLWVDSQGTVRPRTESGLVPEVSGKIIEVSPSFESGGFFEADEVLLRIEASDYEQTVVQVRAQVAQADLRVAREEAEAMIAQQEWRDLGADAEAPPLTRRELQLADARASAAAARASLERAQRDLERTVIRAPYVGRIRDKQVDLGQFVVRGTPVATIYAVDFAEIVLPLPDEDLAYLDLPLDFRGRKSGMLGPEVTLRAGFAGRTFEWQGRIVRLGGEIDVRSRMVQAVVRVEDPYGREAPGRPPLAVGLYVDAEIKGRMAENVAVVPRSAIRDGNQVLIVDADDRIRFRPVEILRIAGESAILSGGLANGDRICLSALAVVSDGMQVRTRTDEDAA